MFRKRRSNLPGVRIDQRLRGRVRRGRIELSGTARTRSELRRTRLQQTRSIGALDRHIPAVHPNQRREDGECECNPRDHERGRVWRCAEKKRDGHQAQRKRRAREDEVAYDAKQTLPSPQSVEITLGCVRTHGWNLRPSTPTERRIRKHETSRTLARFCGYSRAARARRKRTRRSTGILSSAWLNALGWMVPFPL